MYKFEQESLLLTELKLGKRRREKKERNLIFKVIPSRIFELNMSLDHKLRLKGLKA